MEDFGEHFGADEDEDEGEAFLEVVKFVEDAFEEEEERSESHDGENVAGEDDERVMGNGESCGNRVDSKNNVGGFDH